MNHIELHLIPWTSAIDGLFIFKKPSYLQLQISAGIRSSFLIRTSARGNRRKIVKITWRLVFPNDVCDFHLMPLHFWWHLYKYLMSHSDCCFFRELWVLEGILGFFPWCIFNWQGSVCMSHVHSIMKFITTTCEQILWFPRLSDTSDIDDEKKAA